MVVVLSTSLLFVMNCQQPIDLQKESSIFHNLEEFLTYLINYLDKIEVRFSSDQRHRLFSFSSVKAFVIESRLCISNDYERLKILIDGLYEFVTEDEYRDRIIACINANYIAVDDQEEVTNQCYQSLDYLLGGSDSGISSRCLK